MAFFVPFAQYTNRTDLSLIKARFFVGKQLSIRLPADKGGGGQTAGGRDDWSPGGITSMEALESNLSPLPEANIETNGVSYMTDCIAPACVEPSA